MYCRSKVRTSQHMKPKALNNVNQVCCYLVHGEFGAAEVIDFVPHVGTFELSPLGVVPGHVPYEWRHVRLLLRGNTLIDKSGRKEKSRFDIVC